MVFPLKPPFSYGFPMVFPLKPPFSYGFPMVFPLKHPFSYGFPMVFLRFSYGKSHGSMISPPPHLRHHGSKAQPRFAELWLHVLAAAHHDAALVAAAHHAPGTGRPGRRGWHGGRSIVQVHGFFPSFTHLWNINMVIYDHYIMGL